MLLTDAQESRTAAWGGRGGGGVQLFQIIRSGLFRCMGFLHDPATALLMLQTSSLDSVKLHRHNEMYKWSLLNGLKLS